MTYKLTYTKL